jgi:hypothetical protein
VEAGIGDPGRFDWPSLTSKDVDALETHYGHILAELGKSGGMLGIIFRKAQNKIHDPAKLKRWIVDCVRPSPERQSARRSRRPVRPGLDQSAVRQEVERDGRE